MAPAAFRALAFVVYAFCSYGILFHVPQTLKALTPAPVATIAILLWLGLGLGFAGQLLFDWHRRHSYLTVLGRTSLALLLVSALLVVLWVETVICIAMALPIAIAAAAPGIWFTRLLMARFERQAHFCLALLAVPFAAPFFDLPVPDMSEHVSVSTSIVIAAPKSVIRAEAENVSNIAESEQIWTITHNLLRAPRPVSAATRDGIRYATWTKGVRFEEHLLPGPDLAWRFAFPDPELMKALDPRVSPIGPEVTMLEGRYSFEPLGPSLTRVTLTTTYRLNTPINPYLKPWGHLILTDMHNAVLHVITNRAESRS
ncbi:hypothetical protein [Oceanicola sp. 502str15]|uniref:hypothetical protein n=1 Tax=Oceanicola sp. 502str15 TaxID=2696061 RepID=UPI002096545A|nr:hypothetical protein [Oceanicola sp. 502str15]MCO6384162.1 hypothetical protein [Oceanicola sp. 502str15]